MACRVGGLNAWFEVYPVLHRAALMSTNRDLGPEERLGLVNQFRDLEGRVDDISSSIRAQGKHVAYPPRRYMDYTPTKNALSELQQKLRAEREQLNILINKSRDLSIPALDARIELISTALDDEQLNCQREIENTKKVIRNYWPKMVLNKLARFLFT